MSEMVERVAKAILVRSFGAGSTDATSVSIEYARAAIAAMREPIAEMILAGDDAESFSEGDVVGIWQSMIDEALK